MSIMYGRGIEPAEALSACGFEGMLHGLDDKGKAIILRFPEGLEKAYQADKSLVAGVEENKGLVIPSRRC